MKTLFAVIIGLTISVIFTSCANQVYSLSYSPINKQYAQQIDQISLGMSKEELKTILPELHVRGQTFVEGEIVEALELQHNYWAGVGGALVHDRLWFYFYNGRLVKWGSLMIGHRSQILLLKNDIVDALNTCCLTMSFA